MMMMMMMMMIIIIIIIIIITNEISTTFACTGKLFGDIYLSMYTCL